MARLPLRGADLVLLAMPALHKRARISNNALLAVDCDGPVDAGRLRRALDRFLDVCPWPAARLRRSFPWGRLHWAAGRRERLIPPPIRRATAHSHEALHAELEAELNAAIDARRDPLVRFAIIDHPGADGGVAGVFAMTWFHPLMDPRGGQNLLGHLARLDEDPAWQPSPAGMVSPRDDRPLRERGQIARASLAYMRTLASSPIVSPGTGLSTPGPARFRVDSVDAPAPRSATREIAWHLAVVGRAMAELWRRRRLPADDPFLVAVAVDVRPKGEPGPTFGNALAFHFARFTPAETRDPGALARRLRRQMADALRDGQIQANQVAMEFLHYRPISMMLREMPGAARAETFSFNCADVGAFPSADTRIFGRRVANAYHVPAVSPRPGVGVFFNRCGAVTNIITSWIDGAVTAQEVAEIVDSVRRDMGWTARG